MEMDMRAFEQCALGEWERVPARFKGLIDNVALLVEDEPSTELRLEEGLEEGETLLGLYSGIPLTHRGSDYGVGGTIPDTITLFRLPILEEASELDYEPRDAVRRVLRDTIWHEVGHYLGLEESDIHEREEEGTNHYPKES